ncbi:MAG: hypothetical protein Q3966_03485 [Neisseria sp.]|nr:hypothetical protein [Neisseria sp.]
MKIISKFKDFYDHAVAKYGIDPVLVFDRRQPPEAEILHSLPKPPAEWEKEYGACAVVSELYIGNLRVYLFATDEKVYTSYDVGQNFGKKYGRFSIRAIRFQDGAEYALPQYGNYYWAWHDEIQNTDFQAARRNRDGTILKPYRDIPLLLVYYADPNRPTRMNLQRDFAANPQLSALGIYIDPDIVWQNICEYLSQLKSEAETSPPVPDKAKIGNKGFDEKYSFRPKMKRK